MLIASMLITAIPALAQTTVGYSQTGDKLILSGTTSADSVAVAIFRQEAFLDDGVFDSDAAFAALEDAVDKNSVLLYSNQTEADDGEYEFSIRFVRYPGMSADAALSGVYTAVIKAGDDITEQDMLYVLPAEKTTALEKLAKYKDEDSSTRKASVSAFLRNNKYALGIHTEHFDDLTADELNTLLYNKVEEYAYSFGDGDTFISELKKLVAIQTLNDSKVSGIDALKEELGLTGEAFGKWYTGKIVDNNFKTALTGRLSGKDICSVEDFDKKLKEALTLTYNEKSDGIDYIKDIFEAFKGDFGIAASYSDDAYRSVTGETYGSFALLADALDDYKPDSSDDSSTSTKKDKTNGGGVRVSAPAVPVTPVVTIPPISSGFVDVPNDHWASKAVYALKDKGIIAGKTATEFCPNDNITREEFVKLVAAMTGIELTSEALPFSDTDDSAWYAPYLGAAYKGGIVKGSNDGSFGVGNPITRQDIAVMLVRAAETVGADLAAVKEKTEFADALAISDYAKDAVEKLQLSGVISGYTDGSVKPLGLATRAEAAQMIYNVILLLK